MTVLNFFGSALKEAFFLLGAWVFFAYAKALLWGAEISVSGPGFVCFFVLGVVVCALKSYSENGRIFCNAKNS